MHNFATKDTNKNPFIQLCALFFDFCQSFVIQKRAATKIYYGGRAGISLLNPMKGLSDTCRR